MTSERGGSRAQLLIHGGAGPTTRSGLAPDVRRVTERGLARALRAGWAVMDRGGSALEGVIAAVVALEDEPVFNAGRGAVLRDDGCAVLDASIMFGADCSGGAVAGLRTTRNPIRAAEALRAAGRHVLLAGPGADAYASAAGLEQVAPSYFQTEERQRHFEIARRSGSIELDRALGESDRDTDGGAAVLEGETVGAVAVDELGNCAAATSTGGMTNAAAARVGDSPILGAGTWADDRSVAISATGAGEAFIRAAFASQVAGRLRFGSESFEAACRAALGEVLALGGRGGCIAIARNGCFDMPFNTASMPRGRIFRGSHPTVAIFADEELRPIAD